MTYKVTESEFTRLKWLFAQPRAAWSIALSYPHLSDTARQIIREVLAEKMSVEQVTGKSPSQLPTDRTLSKQEIKDLYTKSGVGKVVCFGRPIHRFTR